MKDEQKSRLSSLVIKARAKMSLNKFADLLGVAVGTVQGWESGKSTPTLEHLEKIAISAGYKPEDVMAYLNGQSLPSPISQQFMVSRIKYMHPQELAVVGRAVSDRLFAIAESVG